jgi:sulfite reductase (ferredoxin)
MNTGRLHITTRQDIQIHYVSLDRTPELWAQLAIDDITLREACGNTVRNTASELAGVDVDEPLTSHLMRMRCFSSSEKSYLSRNGT